MSFLFFPFHRRANRKLASGAILLGVVPTAAALDAISIAVEVLPVDDQLLPHTSDRVFLDLYYNDA